MPKSSKLWNYFVKSEDHDFMAICQFCGKLFSYKTTSSNLKAHLKQKHPLVYDDLLQTSESDLSAVLNNDESNHSTAEADAWSFFEKETGGRARCVVCRASLPHRIRDLRQHLKDNHPKLAQDFDQASDSDEDQNDSYTEVVYLEEETRKVKKPQKIPRISYTNSPMVKPAKISKLNTSTNERHDENDDQIEKFSNYVASLLKEVPKDACMKLQMEIINLIMTTKLKLTTETTENKMIIDGVPVAIQTVNAVPGAGFIVTVPTTVSTAHPAPVAPTVPQNKPTFTVEDTKESMNECRDLPKL
ncbi:uncharacterized protein LOC106720889 isoform X2 [Papilio machaon]|uniref:uncharacterized protein LOC106720889 isoform X2 n=1 Tax=Papilio machaon TaxID=76193 RepID=UPI001E666167|nr:uncharacterized protein LOC106720889 isoform X2 [Papilio machaon]